MKRLAFLAVCALLLACSSGSKVKILRPEIEFVQLVGPADLNYPTGDIEVQYGIRVANRSSETITLRRIELTSVASGGPYTLKRGEAYHFARDVGPDQFMDIAFWAKATADGNRMASDATAPVTVRATAYFDAPSGGFRQVLLRTFHQYGNESRRGR